MYLRTGAALLFMLMTGAAALAADDRYPGTSPDNKLEGSEDEHAICMPDAMKLCEDAMPARAAVLKCLQANRRALSKDCRDVLRSKGR